MTPRLTVVQMCSSQVAADQVPFQHSLKLVPGRMFWLSDWKKDVLVSIDP